MTVSVPKRPRGTSPSFKLVNSVEVEVIRTVSEDVWVKGKPVKGETEVFTIDANVQPMRGWEQAQLPEGDRNKVSIKLYTTTPLRTVTEVGSKSADVIIWNGDKYEVNSMFQYQMNVLNHTKVICFRLPKTPNDKASYGSESLP